MLTQKKALTFNREKNNRWYVESKEWEDLQTRIFRQTHTYEDEDGKIQQMDESFELLLRSRVTETGR